MTSPEPNIPLRRVPALLYRLAGPRATTFLVLGALVGFAQSWIDIALSAYLSLFVASIGLMSDVSAPGIEYLPHGSPLVVSLGLLTAGIVRSVCLLLGGACTIFGMEGVNTRLRFLMLKRLLDVGRRRSPAPAADTMLRLDQNYPKTVLTFSGLIQLASALVQAAALFAFTLVLAPREAFAGVAGLGIVGLFIVGLSRRIQGHMAELPVFYGQVASGLERITRSQLLIRVLRTEPIEFPRLKAVVLNAYHRYVAALSLGAIVGSLPQACGVLLIVGIIQVSQSTWHTPGGVLLSFIYLFFRLVQAVSSVSSLGSSLVTMYPYFVRTLRDVEEESDERLAKALSFVPTETGLSPRPVLPIHADAALPAIEVVNASFRYDGSESWALRDFSLSVPAGGSVGITGPSGCGKSTLVQLVLGVLSPTSGSVAVGGRDTRTVQPIEHVRIGYVGAEPFLFEGTIAENLRYGLPSETTAQEEWDALSAARVGDFVRGLPDGLGARLGEGGDGLSAGQKQRLSLARALLGKPQLLVLDEATANLDTVTETEVAESLASIAGNVTVLIIAHRAGILTHCDHVVRMMTP